MANFFHSVAYASENVHSGMIAYLCELWNEGKREPLRSFLDGLGVLLETENGLRPDRGASTLDLVVHDNKNDSPILAVEMKVDSHEGRVKGVPQTIAYPKLLPESTPFLFVTLGAGEFYHAPHGQRARWIRLGRFHEALKGISTDDLFIERWREAIGKELGLRENCFSSDPTGIEDYRGKTWNLYLLGHLKDRLTESFSSRKLGIDPFVYPHGRGADTILYFGRSRLPAYMEINQNGRLNLKVYLGDLDKKERPKRERAQKARAYYQELLEGYNPKPNPRKPQANARSRTIMSFEIGVERRDGNLFPRASEADIVERLSEIIQRFFGTVPFEDVEIDPSVHPPYFQRDME